MTATMPTAVPALTRPRRPRKSSVAQRITASGLRIVAVRKAGVPLVELRLRIPFLGPGATHPARATLLSDTMLTGAGDYDRAGLAAAVQALGGDLGASVDADRLVVSGNVLATQLPRLLELVSLVVTAPTYRPDEVATERTRQVERLTIARSRPATIAAERLALRMWGEHPYALDLPQPDDVAATTAAQVRALHRSRVRPDGAVLVLVGDLAPARALDLAERALGGWAGRPPQARVAGLPTRPAGPLLVVDRPGAVQSSMRLATAAVPRTDERYPALQLANLIFGGYFSSRWTTNIREDKGYTYGPHSRIDHHWLGSVLTLEAEVATDVTAPAMLETRYELGRIATVPATEDELASARQYAIGTLALSTSTQAGLASTLSALSAFGLGLDWIREHPTRLAAVTIDDVAAAAGEFLAPAGFTSVAVGDAAAIGAPLSLLGPVER